MVPGTALTVSHPTPAGGRLHSTLSFGGFCLAVKRAIQTSQFSDALADFHSSDADDGFFSDLLFLCSIWSLVFYLYYITLDDERYSIIYT